MGFESIDFEREGKYNLFYILEWVGIYESNRQNGKDYKAKSRRLLAQQSPL